MKLLFRMASRLVLVIGDLFIPDRAPVSGGGFVGLFVPRMDKVADFC